MRILIIGGTAFMGREIARQLAARGDAVTLFHRGATHDLGAAVGNVQGDRADVASVVRTLRDGRFEAVFDLAYDWQRGTPAAQVAGVAAACAGQVQRYVFMSSIAAYGPGLDHRETGALVADDFPDPYAQHKAAAERALFRLHADAGLSVTTFRPPFVHGPRQPFYREQFFWDRLLDKRPIILPDDGRTPIQLVFAPDVAKACIRALDVPDASGQSFNVAHTERLTQRTFVDALARAAGVPATFAPMPRARIHERGGNVFAGNLYFGQVLDLPPHTSVVEKVRQVLGITPTPLDAALAKGFAWYKTQPRQPVDYSFEDRLLAM